MSSYVSNLFSVEGKVAIVTGGASGNGRAISEGLLNAGASVVIVDNNPVLLSQALDTFSEQQHRLAILKEDITHENAEKRIVDFAIEQFGEVNILINNAGVSFPKEENYPKDLWEKTFDVNLKGPFLLMREVANAMKSNGGSIINITSLNSELAFPNNPAYVASKGGLKQLTKSFALDYGKYNIRVNNVGPGYMKTGMTKKSWANKQTRKERSDRTVLGRWGDPVDLVGSIIFLSSDASSYVTGQDLYVDGGWCIKGL